MDQVQNVPSIADTYADIGDKLLDQQKPDAAEEYFQAALAIDKQHVPASHGLACAMLAQGFVARARAILTNLVRTGTANADIWCDLATAAALDDIHEGIKEFRRVVDAFPRSVKGLVQLGCALASAAQFKEAQIQLEQALRLAPGHRETHLQLALVYLIEGDFLRGWKEYEWRPTARYVEPQWCGEPLQGDFILLHAEQGLGDTLQMVRYVPMVAARGGRVLLEIPAALKRVLSEFPGVYKLVVRGQPRPPFRWQCPLMSLPLAFGTTLDTIPHTTPYLRVADRPSAGCIERPRLNRLRVGVAWAGNKKHLNDRNRSLPLELLASIGRIPGIDFFSLQKGPAADQISSFPHMQPADASGPEITDMEDTARLIMSLDLVITVDTAIAHLAGALGKQVWILLSLPHDWRWLLGTRDSPWYPTARLFRQRTPGRWSDVIDELTLALTAECYLPRDKSR